MRGTFGIFCSIWNFYVGLLAPRILTEPLTMFCGTLFGKRWVMQYAIEPQLPSWEGLVLISSPRRPDRSWDPPSLLCNWHRRCCGQDKQLTSYVHVMQVQSSERIYRYCTPPYVFWCGVYLGIRKTYHYEGQSMQKIRNTYKTFGVNLNGRYHVSFLRMDFTDTLPTKCKGCFMFISGYNGLIINNGSQKHNYICKYNNFPTTCFGLIRPSSGWKYSVRGKLSVWHCISNLKMAELGRNM